jgi:hypothetical protein
MNWWPTVVEHYSEDLAKEQTKSEYNDAGVDTA